MLNCKTYSHRSEPRIGPPSAARHLWFAAKVKVEAHVAERANGKEGQVSFFFFIKIWITASGALLRKLKVDVQLLYSLSNLHSANLSPHFTMGILVIQLHNDIFLTCFSLQSQHQFVEKKIIQLPPILSMTTL